MRRFIILLGSLSIAVVVVVTALLYVPKPASGGAAAVAAAQLQANDGLSGHPCWVAVDGTVYAISGFASWELGRHLPAGNRANCGRDLTAVIGQSPHGKSVLQLLRVVGAYAGP